MIRQIWKHTVFQNTASLYLIQFVQYLLPLITVPYLVRVLGPTIYGTIAFGQSLIAIFMLFTDYGFRLSATRKISVERNDKLAVSSTAMNVWGGKVLICLVGLLFLFILINTIPKFREINLVLVLLYGTVIGSVIFPIWLFLGMEKMVFISVINLIMQVFITIGIFALVNKPADALIYVGLLSAGALTAGVTGAIVAIKIFHLKLHFPSLRSIHGALVEGWTLFLSNTSVSLYTAGNPLILGFLSNNTVVGYYVAAERIVKLVVKLLEPISQAAYPRMSKLATESKDFVLYWAKRALFLQGGLGFGLSLILFFGSPLIVGVLFGESYFPSILVMRILSPLPFLIGIGTSFGRFILLPFRYDKARFIIFLMAGGINILLAVLLVPRFSSSGMAVAVLLSEIFVVTLFYLFLQSKGLNPV